MIRSPRPPTSCSGANLGHLVWEEAFPLLLAMAQLGAYDERAIVLREMHSEGGYGVGPYLASKVRAHRHPMSMRIQVVGVVGSRTNFRFY